METAESTSSSEKEGAPDQTSEVSFGRLMGAREYSAFRKSRQPHNLDRSSEADEHEDTGTTSRGLTVSPPPPPYPDVSALRQAIQTAEKPYTLSEEQVLFFRQNGFIRLRSVFDPHLLAAVRHAIVGIMLPACKGRNPSEPSDPLPPAGTRVEEEEAKDLWHRMSEPQTKSWHIQMAWAIDETVRAMVLAPRLSSILCRLLETPRVRLYHDNCLSRAPGCPTTKWHCDDGPGKHMITASEKVVTVWVPLQDTPCHMGALAFVRRDGRGGVSDSAVVPSAWTVAASDGCPDDEKSDAYDEFVSRLLEEREDLQVDCADYACGDVSIHSTNCFHTASPNTTTSVRMIMGTTYVADGARARSEEEFEEVGEGKRKAWAKFCPGVGPGQELNSKLNPLLRVCRD
uniref:Phytanoyl-CoA dioxygenase n=1 Tax=Chromera velia CCMP2878 TaxID=1169474 RepID=A0A0G4HB89_9ALVE|eukprot:Cvel_25899.t1-p1 / transcript=Cvel_25899.t1 / gene=Cvel_25899 / organism=Chromera_velia_CCMP2878 / gene_product=hypothetical protein / transcript_product=hypothetical protein / location=Cvel_scaffold2992:12324-13520(+) / protein_length=399 / sequence_SO=supercontig / SO=protein_coding / is_pseudo=false